jgi:hypothetical protein
VLAFSSQAFRIVTTMPVVLLKSATKQLQEGFQAARERLSIGSAGRSSSERLSIGSVGRSSSGRMSIGSAGRSSSFSDHSERARKILSFENAAVNMESNSNQSVIPHPIMETSMEFDDGSTDLTEERKGSGSRRKSDDRAHKSPNVFSIFHKKKSDVSDISSEDKSSRVASFFAKKRDSDLSAAGSDDSRPESSRMAALFRRNPSDISAAMQSDDGNGERRSRSRIPGMVRKSLFALKRGVGTNNDKKG